TSPRSKPPRSLAPRLARKNVSNLDGTSSPAVLQAPDRGRERPPPAPGRHGTLSTNARDQRRIRLLHRRCASHRRQRRSDARATKLCPNRSRRKRRAKDRPRQKSVERRLAREDREHAAIASTPE